MLGARLRFARELDVTGLTPNGRRSWQAQARIGDYRGFTPDTTH